MIAQVAVQSFPNSGEDRTTSLPSEQVPCRAQIYHSTSVDGISEVINPFVDIQITSIFFADIKDSIEVTSKNVRFLPILKKLPQKTPCLETVSNLGVTVESTEGPYRRGVVVDLANYVVARKGF